MEHLRSPPGQWLFARDHRGGRPLEVDVRLAANAVVTDRPSLSARDITPFG
jgi:hypothetical protein